jgi:hypothetical protein
MRSTSTFGSALLSIVFASTAAVAQTAPQVLNLEGGVGTPTPSLNATPPVQGADLTIFATGFPAYAPVVLFITAPVAPPLDLGGGAALHVDPYSGMSFIGLADAFGAFTLFAPGAATLGFPAGLVCNAQAAAFVSAGTPGALDFGTFGVVLTNGIALVMGDLPQVPFNDVPVGSISTYSKGGYQGGGAPAALLANNYAAVFPNGLTVGIYSPGNGATPPNGKHFTATPTGLAALQGYLSGGGPSGAFVGNDVNTSAPLGAGVFGKQIAALILNVALNDAAVVPNSGGFGDLVYLAVGDSLHGATVRQILGAAQNAVAGLGLPSGYTYSSLQTLVEALNLSFHEGVESPWADQHLFLKN